MYTLDTPQVHWIHPRYTQDTLDTPRIHPIYTPDTSLDTPLIHPGGGLVTFDFPVDSWYQVIPWKVSWSTELTKENWFLTRRIIPTIWHFLPKNQTEGRLFYLYFTYLNRKKDSIRLTLYYPIVHWLKKSWMALYLCSCLVGLFLWRYYGYSNQQIVIIRDVPVSTTF